MITALENQSILVTGGASGIGLATVRRLAQHGARVTLADLREENVAAAVAEWADGAVLGQACDVRRAEDCQQLVQRCVEHWGRLDALVHCAGILRGGPARPRALHETDEDEYDAVIDTNLKGTFLMNRAALQPMVAQRSGQIVNLSSTSGRKGRPLDAVYSASKAGVIALSESIAEEVRAFGVRVQVVLPDAVDTPLWRQNGAAAVAPPQSLPPARVAEVIAFCLALPADTICENLVITPFRTRAGRRAVQGGEVAAHAP